MNTINEKIDFIRKTYGDTNQLHKVREELSELDDAIRDYIYNFKPNSFKSEIKSEIADVYVCLRHLISILDLSDFEIQNEIEFKVNRELDRINNRKKDNTLCFDLCKNHNAFWNIND